MDRECTKDYEIELGDGKKLTIKKGQLVFLPFYSLHHDERYFPNPEKFDPYRFSDANKDSIVSGSYLPFGSGPRVCIGKYLISKYFIAFFNKNKLQEADLP